MNVSTRDGIVSDVKSKIHHATGSGNALAMFEHHKQVNELGDAIMKGVDRYVQIKVREAKASMVRELIRNDCYTFDAKKVDYVPVERLKHVAEIYEAQTKRLIESEEKYYAAH